MDKLKVLQFGPVDIRYGGPTLSTYLTIKGLEQNNMEVDILTYYIDDKSYMIDEKVKAFFMEKPIIKANFGYVPSLQKRLNCLPKYDIYHVQGCWEYPGLVMAKRARHYGAPYVLTLRGVLYPQSIDSIVKKIALKTYAGKLLSGASCIQATCEEEMSYYRQLGFTNPVAIIPNPIETKGIIEREINTPDKLRIGYLGRIHPRKRIERLIYAFDALRDKLSNSELVIIGGDVPEYEEFLKKEVERLKLKNVRFAGFLKGKEKDEAICSLSYLIVPSDFENFGNIVTEALVRGVPVVASKGMPWKCLEDNGCGWWIDNDQSSINKIVSELIEIPESQRKTMGINGKHMIERDFSISALGKKMTEVYMWVLGKTQKPSFVYTLE